MKGKFGADFGTTINNDIIMRAGHDPNRTKSLLSKEHMDAVRQEQIKVAEELAAKRASSSRGIQ